MTAGSEEDMPSRSASVPGYEIEKELGRGGMGVVYQARQLAPRRRVALKMLLGGEHADPRHRTLFQAEAEAVAALQHPNVVQIFEVGQHQGLPFLALEFCPGDSLSARLERGPLSLDEAVALMQTLARAIHEAHRRGIIHRDLKPANVLLGEEGSPKVTDFGLAKRLDDERDQSRTGTVMGTPGYMAPEQVAGRVHEIGPWTDVYALGVILFECLTGRRPFEGPQDLVRFHTLETEAPSPRKFNRKVPRDLETICLKCLHKQGHRRYGSAEELAEDLRRFRQHEPIVARRAGVGGRAWRWCKRNPVVAGLLTVLILVLIAGTVVSTFFAINAEQQAEQARINETKAVQKSEQLQQANTDLKQTRDDLKKVNTKLKEEHDAAIAAGHLAKRREQETRRLLYVSRMNRAHRSIHDGDVSNALQLLEAQVPGPDEEDLRHWEWYYLKRLCRSDLFTLKGHTSHVWGVAFSPDGKLMVSGSHDHTVKLWDARTGKEVKTLTGHRGKVYGVAFSPDGKRVASSSLDNTVRLWDVNSGKPVRVLPHQYGVSNVAFSPHGKRVATAAYLGTVWDVETGQPLFTLPDYHEVSYITFDPQGRYLATAGYDQMVKLWDAQSGKWIRDFVGHAGKVRSVAFSPDGATLASASDDQTVALWNVKTGQYRRFLYGHTDWVWGVAFSPDGRLLASSSDDTSIKVWSAVTGRLLFTIRGHALGIATVTFSPDSWRLASASDDKTVKVWDLMAHYEALTLGEHSQSVSRVVFSPDGKQLVSAGSDHLLKIWDSGGGRDVRTLTESEGPILDVAFIPNKRALVSVGGFIGKSGFIQVRDLTTGEARRLGDHKEPMSDFVIDPMAYGGVARRLGDHKEPIRTVAVHPDGKLLATGGMDGAVRVWNLDTGEAISTLGTHPSKVTSVAFNSDGRLLASANGDFDAKAPGEIKLWDTRTWREAGTLQEKTDQVNEVAFSPDGRYLAAATERGGVAITGKEPGLVKIWDLKEGQITRTLSGHLRKVTCVAFSADGRRLVSGSADDTIKIWDVLTWQELITLRGHSNTVTSVTFSPDGKRLASAGWDGKVNIWDAEQQVRRQPSPETLLSWHERAASAAEADKHWFAALFHLSRLAQGKPKDGEVFLRRGRAHAKREQWPQALADYSRAVELMPHDGAARLGRYLAHAQLNQPERGEKDYLAALASSPVIRLNADTPWFRRADGTLSFSQRTHWTNAVLDLNNLIKGGQDNWWTHRSLGLAWAMLTRSKRILAEFGEDRVWQQALSEFSKATSERPDDVESWRGKARAHAELKEWDEAIRACSKAIDLKKEDAALWYLRGIAQARSQGHDKAIADFTQAIALGGRGAGVFTERGQAYAEQAAWKKAVADLAQAAALRPDDSGVWYRLGLARLGNDDLAGYRDVCALMIKRFGETQHAETAANVAFLAVLAPATVQDHAPVVQLAQVAVTADTANPAYLETLGAALYRTGRYPESVQRLTEAVRTHGGSGSVWMQLFLAMAHHRLQHTQEATAWLTRAVQQMDKDLGPANKKDAPRWQQRLRWKFLREEVESLLNSG
jgi:WD40 repeat protein/tetratricopeptide (TPR) repeat protein/cell division protein FtsB